jgi:2-polyprenyl-3-methyl-5-hydroxy-6-metoxy-1,4-benzoquinol methylase
LDTDAESYYFKTGDHPDLWIEDRVQRQGLRTYEKWLTGRILQLGYGTGTMARLIARDHDLSVIEGSTLLARHCRADGVPCWESMFEDWEPMVNAQRFDTALAGHVLEHVDEPIAVARMISGWLTRQGIAVFVVPNADSLHRRLGEVMGFGSRFDLSPRDRLVGHQRVFTLDGLCEVVDAAGFNIVDMGGFFVKSVPNAAMLSYPTERQHLRRRLRHLDSHVPLDD